MTFATRIQHLQSKSTWDRRLMALAQHVAGWSKDPSTKVGAVIADHHNRILGVGYNGFARSIEDSPDRLDDRETKLALTIHAEANALLNSTGSVEGATLYCWPLPPCSACASLLVQRGIRRVVAPELSGKLLERWGASCVLALEVLLEAGVELVEVPSEES